MQYFFVKKENALKFCYLHVISHCFETAQKPIAIRSKVVLFHFFRILKKGVQTFFFQLLKNSRNFAFLVVMVPKQVHTLRSRREIV